MAPRTIVEPISLAPPTAKDLEQTEELEAYLISQGLYESREESELREEVLGELAALVGVWIRGVAKRRGVPEDDARALIYTFGSYRLGVHGPGSDIDTLCVGPQYAERYGDYFGPDEWTLESRLRRARSCEQLAAVPGAYVPVLKLKFRGISVDLLYAQLGVPAVREGTDLVGVATLRKADDRSVRSLNGCRVTDAILASVPDVEAFRSALRFVKMWAERRGIYSNVTGYLGGVNWAVLLAYCHCLHPRAAASTLVRKFFRVLASWEWPTPIMLAEIQRDDSLNLPVWDPRENARDRFHLMPIITPVYPAMNSAYNVSEGTLAVMRAEFVRGDEICRGPVAPPAAGEAAGGADRPAPPGLDDTVWARLAEPYAFFASSRHFLQVVAYASDETDGEVWEGWVTSRMRLLVKAASATVDVRPWPKALRPPPGDLGAAEGARYAAHFYLGLAKKTPAAVALGPRAAALAALASAHASPFPTATNRVDLTLPVNEFSVRVMDWPEKREGMDVIVRHLKREQLPAWVRGKGQAPAGGAPEAAAPPAGAHPPSAAAPGDARPAAAGPASGVKPARPAGSPPEDDRASKRPREPMEVDAVGVAPAAPSTAAHDPRNGPAPSTAPPRPSAPAPSIATPSSITPASSPPLASYATPGASAGSVSIATAAGTDHAASDRAAEAERRDANAARAEASIASLGPELGDWTVVDGARGEGEGPEDGTPQLDARLPGAPGRGAKPLARKPLVVRLQPS